jgi:hypothetical protein
MLNRGNTHPTSRCLAGQKTIVRMVVRCKTFDATSQDKQIYNLAQVRIEPQLQLQNETLSFASCSVLRYFQSCALNLAESLSSNCRAEHCPPTTTILTRYPSSPASHTMGDRGLHTSVWATRSNREAQLTHRSGDWMCPTCGFANF